MLYSVQQKNAHIQPSYLESGRKVDSVQPWFWIVLLFFVRVGRSVVDEWFMFKQVCHSKRRSFLFLMVA